MAHVSEAPFKGCSREIEAEGLQKRAFNFHVSDSGIAEIISAASSGPFASLRRIYGANLFM